MVKTWGLIVSYFDFFVILAFYLLDFYPRDWEFEAHLFDLFFDAGVHGFVGDVGDYRVDPVCDEFHFRFFHASCCDGWGAETDAGWVEW